MAADFYIGKEQGSGIFQAHGNLDLYHINEVKTELQKTLKNASTQAVIDMSGLKKLDTVGALLLVQLQQKHNIKIEHLQQGHAELFKLVAKAKIAPPKPVRPESAWRRLLEGLGKKTINAWESSIEMITFFGRVCVTIPKTFSSWKHFRFADISHHIEETGIQAIPIISLIAFMISVVVAYQAVAQLRPLGAERLTVNLVALSVLREMGVLLTAIMTAGRSGSAFTAEIGVMKAREEVDALQVIGIDPFEVLVLPRLIALVITLPLLTFIADITGLLGGGVMSLLLIDISLPQYIDRVREVAHGHDFLVGMIKAPAFAFLIAIVGCMHGMKVAGSAESVGRETTASVVKAIFLVLVADAMFSVVFEKMGI